MNNLLKLRLVLPDFYLLLIDYKHIMRKILSFFSQLCRLFCKGETR